MAIYPVVIWEGQLGSSIGDMGDACPSNTRIVIKSANFVNTDTVARYFSVYLVPSGGSYGADNIQVQQFPLSPGESYPCPELIGQVMTVGALLRGLAEAADKITGRICGVSQV